MACTHWLCCSSRGEQEHATLRSRSAPSSWQRSQCLSLTPSWEPRMPAAASLAVGRFPRQRWWRTWRCGSACGAARCSSGSPGATEVIVEQLTARCALSSRWRPSSKAELGHQSQRGSFSLGNLRPTHGATALATMFEVSEKDVREQPGPAVARCSRSSIVSFTEQFEPITRC